MALRDLRAGQRQIQGFQLRAEVHGGGLESLHLCMYIPRTTYDESIVMTNPVVREPLVDSSGLVRTPSLPGVGFEDIWHNLPWTAQPMMVQSAVTSLFDS